MVKENKKEKIKKTKACSAPAPSKSSEFKNKKLVKNIDNKKNLKEEKASVLTTKKIISAKKPLTPEQWKEWVRQDDVEFFKDSVENGFGVEVYDETDYAQHLQLTEQANLIKKALQMNKPETHPDFDGVHCIECGIVIPEGRIKLKKMRCVDCQEEVDFINKRKNPIR